MLGFMRFICCAACRLLQACLRGSHAGVTKLGKQLDMHLLWSPAVFSRS